MQQKSSILHFMLLTIFLFSLSGLKFAQAHELEQSFVFLTISDDSIEGRLEINLIDLNKMIQTDLPEDKTANLEMIEPYFDTIREYINNNVAIDLGEGFKATEFDLITYPHLQYLLVPFSFDNLPAIPDYIDLEYSVLMDINPQHKGIVVIENDWRSGTFHAETNIVLAFSEGDGSKRLTLSGPTIMQGYIEMMKLGVHHIWEGIDHILFLIALLLPCVLRRVDGKWQSVDKFYPAFIYVVKVVTVFTVAHTITLSAATLGWLSMPSRLVESIIAISIAIAALDILVPIFRGRIWIIIFIFGLFHGFGFASVLAEYRIPDDYLTWSLLAFNIGVELGQIAIVVAVVPVLYLLRNLVFYIPVIVRFGAIALIVVSLYWFIERGFEVDLPAGSMLNWFLGLFS